MIVNFEIKNIDEIFLEHRNGIDPLNYRIGTIDGKIYCFNPNTNKIMEYYFDDVDDEWFNLKIIFPNISPINTYEISREGILRKRGKSGLVYKKIGYTSDGYPRYSVPITSDKDKKFTIHRILAQMFVPNLDPIKNTIVDHIDRNILNFELKNLRWVNPIVSASNKTKVKYIDTSVYEAYLDDDFINYKFTLSEEELFLSKHLTKTGLKASIRLNKSYCGFYWKEINSKLKDYLKDDIIDDSKWKLHYTGKFFVNPLGLIKPINSLGKELPITMGSSSVPPYYRYKNSFVHRIVAEVFLNDNNPIPDNLFVDHLDTNPGNNRVENLKICTREENLRNPLTSEKLRKKVYAEGTIFDSISECANYYGVTRQAIHHRIMSKFQPEFKFV